MTDLYFAVNRVILFEPGNHRPEPQYVLTADLVDGKSAPVSGFMLPPAAFGDVPELVQDQLAWNGFRIETPHATAIHACMHTLATKLDKVRDIVDASSYSLAWSFSPTVHTEITHVPDATTVVGIMGIICTDSYPDTTFFVDRLRVSGEYSTLMWQRPPQL